MKIPEMEAVEQSAAPEFKDARDVQDLIRESEITSNAELRVAATWVAEIKTKHAEVDAKRKSFTEPLRAVIDDINDFFKPVLKILKDTETTAKLKISNFTIDRVKERDRILENLDVNAENGEKAQAIERAEQVMPAKISGLSLRESWNGKIVDKKKIVDWAIETKRTDLLDVSEKALVAITKALGRDPGIPGFAAHLSKSVVVTPSKIK